MMHRMILTIAVLVASAFPVVAGAEEEVCGDVNASGSVSAADALLVLRDSVGQDVTLTCPAIEGLAMCSSDLAATSADLASCDARPEGQLLRTGLFTCYDPITAESIPCDGTGQDGELQRGVKRSFTDNGDGTISDDATGLMWEKISNDQSIHHWVFTYSWSEAFEKIDVLNTIVFAGYADWRLPNVRELSSLLDYSTASPATPEKFGTACPLACTVLTCNCVSSWWHWTSTSYRNDPIDVWAIFFGTATIERKNLISKYAVRAVRGGS